jgi:hypothetical protein
LKREEGEGKKEEGKKKEGSEHTDNKPDIKAANGRTNV